MFVNFARQQSDESACAEEEDDVTVGTSQEQAIVAKDEFSGVQVVTPGAPAIPEYECECENTKF